ncbi:hypothetical protein C1J03_16525 [Sulfitobacter sp. SK012]|nr:hypothetical protein C1J03_16525 [Sulfitobacter sp. SK012]
MDIILHVGAHRTGTTSFQHYLQSNAAVLSEDATGYWGPLRTRKGLFSGLFPGVAGASGRNLQRRAEGRVKMHLTLAEQAGVDRLIVSDENMIGSPRHCLRDGLLYPAVGDRMARISSAFGGRISRIVLSLRAQDLWWASTSAYAVYRGHSVPTARHCERIAHTRRGWRDVITDIACAAPEAEIRVLPFEHHVGRPDLLFAAATDRPAPTTHADGWLNRSPDLAAMRTAIKQQDRDASELPEGDGRWQPFAPAHTAAMRETYQDDMMWLSAGADGLATLTQDPTRSRTGKSQPAGDIRQGHSNDQGHSSIPRPRHVARSG